MLWEKETYKYLGILEADTDMQADRKEKKRKDISEEPENYSRKKLCGRNIIKGINSKAVPLVGNSVQFLKRTREERTKGQEN